MPDSCGEAILHMVMKYARYNMEDEAMHLACSLRRRAHAKDPEYECELYCMTTAHKFLFDDRANFNPPLPPDIFSEEVKFMMFIDFKFHVLTRYDRVCEHLSKSGDLERIPSAKLEYVLLMSEIMINDDDVAVRDVLHSIEQHPQGKKKIELKKAPVKGGFKMTISKKKNIKGWPAGVSTSLFHPFGQLSLLGKTSVKVVGGKKCR